MCKELSELHSFLREKKQQPVTNGNFTILKSYIDDFEYVDYLYEHYILEASDQTRKQDYKHVLEEVIRIERKYGKEYNGRSIQNVGIVGEKPSHLILLTMQF